MPTPAQVGLPRWRQLVAAEDFHGLTAAVAPGAAFHSPAKFGPVEGREAVVAYLGAALEVLGDGFGYHRVWRTDASAVVEFTSRVDGREVHGVDIIEWDADGLIRDFTVMIRPLSALNLVIERMAAALAP